MVESIQLIGSTISSRGLCFDRVVFVLPIDLLETVGAFGGYSFWDCFLCCVSSKQ